MLELTQKKLAEKSEQLEVKDQELQKVLKQQQDQLYKISGLTPQGAQDMLLGRLSQELRNETGSIILKHQQELKANADKLAREYILSDAGQINLAKGNARPIRAEHLTLPADVQAKLLPNEQYAKVQPIKDAKAWEATSKALPQLWQEHVIIEME